MNFTEAALAILAKETLNFRTIPYITETSLNDPVGTAFWTCITKSILGGYDARSIAGGLRFSGPARLGLAQLPTVKPLAKYARRKRGRPVFPNLSFGHARALR